MHSLTSKVYPQKSKFTSASKSQIQKINDENVPKLSAEKRYEIVYAKRSTKKVLLIFFPYVLFSIRNGKTMGYSFYQDFMSKFVLLMVKRKLFEVHQNFIFYCRIASGTLKTAVLSTIELGTILVVGCYECQLISEIDENRKSIELEVTSVPQKTPAPVRKFLKRVWNVS